MKHDEKENDLTQLERRKLYDFLSDSAVEENYFRIENGPIDHIYNALTKNSSDIENGEPFQDSTFEKETRELTSILKNAKHMAKPDIIRFANELVQKKELRNRVVKYLNSIVGMVIERTSSISGADVQGIFEEIRKELKTSDKRLTLFIEDINVYKGIDSALIEVLIQEHTEENGLCRLRSVVGSTDRYFDDYFNDALKDRMTRKIVILESTLLEDSAKKIEFAARYINAIHFTKEEIEEWYSSGKEMPIWEDTHKFSEVYIEGRKYSIFPFNENALVNLFSCLNESARSPRGYLKSVVKSVVMLWYKHGEHLIDNKRLLLSSEGISRIGGFIDTNDKMVFDAQKYADADRRELLYQIWGDRTFKLNSNPLGGVTDEVLDLFNVAKVGESIENLTIDEKTPKPKPPTKEQQFVQDTSFEKRIKDIEDWADGIKDEFIPHKDARKQLSEFILKNINWEIEDIPYSIAESFIGKLQNYVIEGQTVEGNGPIFIERSPLTGRLFIALFTQDAQKNSKNAWFFENGPEQEIIAKTWLLKNKNKIISIVRKNVFDGNDIKQLIVDARIAELISLGLVENQTNDELLEKVVRSDCLDLPQKEYRNDEKWGTLYTYFMSKGTDILSVFNLFYLNTVGITRADSGKVKYVIVDSVDLLDRIEKAKKDLVTNKVLLQMNSSDDRINMVANAVQFYKEKSSVCIADMNLFAQKHMEMFTSWLGDEPNEKTIKETISAMEEYLNFIKHDVGYSYPPQMISVLENKQSVTKELVQGIAKLKEITYSKNILDKAILCGTLNTGRINIISKAFSDFEIFMNEKTSVFISKIDLELNRKIEKTKEEIIDNIDNCLIY